LGIRREDIEQADADDPDVGGATRIPVPGTPPA
jgi:hypothetical protein